MPQPDRSPIKRHHIIEFRHALQGLRYALKTQPNFLVHVIATTVVMTAAYFYRISSGELLALVLVIMMVITAELVNTALETTVDLVTEDYHPKAKVAKDLAAAAVLSTSIGALIVGIIVFLPHVAQTLTSIN